MKDHLALAKRVKKAYFHSTFSVAELECLIEKDGKTTYLLFRGTEMSHYADDSFKEKLQDQWDLIRDLRILPWRDRKAKLWGHAGFLRGSRKVVNKLVEDNIIQKGERLHISGHSLGGAIACAVGVFLSRLGYNVIEITGYGSPKTFISKVKDLSFPVTLYRNSNDFVTKVPYGRHIVKLTDIGKKKKTNLKSHPIDRYIESLNEATKNAKKTD